MTDDRVRTVVHTDEGSLDFQHYFVRDQCRPRVSGFDFDGVDSAVPTEAFLEAIRSPRLAAIVVCPSNPFVSVDPVLALSGVADSLREARAPLVAVSPIVGGVALKGPAAKMMAELDVPATALAVAAHYKERDLLDGFVIDRVDAALAPEIEELGVSVLVTGTVMKTLDDRVRLARETLSFAAGLQP